MNKNSHAPLHPLPSPTRMPGNRLFSTRRRRPRASGPALTTRVLQSLLMGVLLSITIYLLLDPLSMALASVVQSGAAMLGLPAMLQQETLHFGKQLLLTRFGLAAAQDAVSGQAALFHMLATAAVLASCSWVKRVPVRHALFALCALHVMGVATAWLQGGEFPHSLYSHTRLIVDTNLLWLALSPAMLAIGFYPVERSAVNRTLATGLFIGWQIAALPLKVLLAAVLIEALTPAVIPLLFIVAGPMLDVLLLSALYSWLMSWPMLQMRDGRIIRTPDLQINPPA